MYVLVWMMGFNNAMREEELNGWTERCIEVPKKIGTDLDKIGYALEIRIPVMGRRGKSIDRIPSYDAVVSDEVALLDLGLCNFIAPRLAVLFLTMRTNDQADVNKR